MLSFSQLLFPNWKMWIMPRSDGQHLLYLFSAYRIDFFLKRHSWLNCSPREREMGLPTLYIHAVASQRRWFHRRDRVQQTGRNNHSVSEASSPVGRLGDSRDRHKADSQSGIFWMERSSFTGTRRDCAWLAVVQVLTELNETRLEGIFVRMQWARKKLFMLSILQWLCLT